MERMGISWELEIFSSNVEESLRHGSEKLVIVVTHFDRRLFQKFQVFSGLVAHAIESYDVEVKSQRIIAVLTALVCFAVSRGLKGTSIAPVHIDKLFTEAGKVVLVKIVSGDTEHYRTAVYKSVVEAAYKGSHQGDTLYFGPFTGERLGTEYVLFLKSVPGKSVPKKSMDSNRDLPYGEITTLDQIMYEGYGSFEVGYECVFDGREISQQCDQSVRLNPDQIILPKNIRTYPSGEATAITNYKKWVRKSVLLTLLESLAKK